MAEREEAKLNDPVARHRQEARLSDQRSRQARVSWEELEAAIDAIKWDKDDDLEFRLEAVSSQLLKARNRA